ARAAPAAPRAASSHAASACPAYQAPYLEDVAASRRARDRRRRFGVGLERLLVGAPAAAAVETVAAVGFAARQAAELEYLDDGVAVQIARELARFRVDAGFDDAGRPRRLDVRNAGERLAHEIDPHRNRRASALLAAAERARQVEADPGRGGDLVRETDEPGVPAVVRRARLAGNVAP